MTTLFDPTRKNKMTVLLHDAKINKNNYNELLDYLEALFYKNPNDPVVTEAVSYIRFNIWPESSRERFLLTHKINKETFSSLRTNYYKFAQNIDQHLSQDSEFTSTLS